MSLQCLKPFNIKTVLWCSSNINAQSTQCLFCPSELPELVGWFWKAVNFCWLPYQAYELFLLLSTGGLELVPGQPASCSATRPEQLSNSGDGISGWVPGHPSFHSPQWDGSQALRMGSQRDMIEGWGLWPIAITSSFTDLFLDFLLFFLTRASGNQLLSKLPESKALSQGLLLGEHERWCVAYNTSWIWPLRLSLSPGDFPRPTTTSYPHQPCLLAILIPWMYNALSNSISLCILLPTP